MNPRTIQLWDTNPVSVEIWRHPSRKDSVVLVLVSGGKDVPKVRHVLIKGTRTSLRTLSDSGFIRDP